MTKEKNEDLIQKIKNLFDSVVPSEISLGYPENAVPKGTFVRCLHNNRLGVVVDGFYGDVDQVGEKIIIYTVLLLPETSSFAVNSLKNDNYYLINEYEYDIVAYLMIPPVDMKEISKNFMGDFL